MEVLLDLLVKAYKMGAFHALIWIDKVVEKGLVSKGDLKTVKKEIDMLKDKCFNEFAESFPSSL